MVRAMKAKKSLKPGDAVQPKMNASSLKCRTALKWRTTKKSLKPRSALQQAMKAFEDAPRIRWVTSYYDRERDELYTPSSTWKTTISGRMYWNVWMNASSLKWRTATTHPFDAALDSPTTPIPTTTAMEAMKVKKAKKGMKKLAKP